MNRSGRGIFSSLQKPTFSYSRLIYISALARKNYKSTNAVGAIEILTVMELQTRHTVNATRETVILPRSDAFILFLSTAAGILIIEAKPLTGE